ncbi:hypothetical protein E4U58_004242 [Claviceps cyperi]|nr:hypothetical protein E4U58_004242 [Claviceps cyperi]
MESRSSGGGHLDASADGEVVYCHACSNEWLRDAHGLTCPRCESEITEIISPENDPRDLAPSPNPSSMDRSNERYMDAPDPDEADIEEHLGAEGTYYRRSTRSRPDQRHHDPSIDPVFERFYDMIQRFGQPFAQPGRTRPSGGSGVFGQANDEEFVPPPRIQRATFTSGAFGGGTASVTIISGPAFATRGTQEGENRESTENAHQEGADPFQTLFSNIIRDIQPPSAGGEQGHPAGPQPGFARGLREILNLFHPSNAMMGDAVYSQEAFDSIITQLMEANPQSNAAPPASEEALRRLDRRVVDKQMLGPEGTAECSICIDEMVIGQIAVTLPCKHWFHEDCVVLWLKEHNTCPVCRTPVEKNDEEPQGTAAVGGSSSSGRATRSGNRRQSPSNASFSFDRNSSDQSRAFSDQAGSGGDTPTGIAAAEMVSSIHVDSHSRPTTPRPSDGLRGMESIHRESNQGMPSRAAATGFSYDTSRLQRRTSHSPTSPRMTPNLAEQGARMRQRSPSEASRRGTSDRDSHRQSGPGPWSSWTQFRDRFTGSGGSGGPQGSHGQGQP